jgi:hypothetical protein
MKSTTHIDSEFLLQFRFCFICFISLTVFSLFCFYEIVVSTLSSKVNDVLPSTNLHGRKMESGRVSPYRELASVVRCIIFVPQSIPSYKDHGVRLLGCDVWSITLTRNCRAITEYVCDSFRQQSTWGIWRYGERVGRWNENILIIFFKY